MNSPRARPPRFHFLPQSLIKMSKGSPATKRRGSQLATLDEMLSPTSSPESSEVNFGRRMSMSSMAGLERGGSFKLDSSSQSVSSLSMSECDFDERESLLLNARRHSKDLQACLAHLGRSPTGA